jgi:hypothetical protein
MSKISLVLLVIGICFVGACGGSGGGAPSIVDPGATTPPAPDPTGLWITSDAGEGLQAYRAKLSTISAERTYAMADAPPGPESADGGFSTTYTLEASIDEADIVKYDGSVLAVAPSRSACCFILEPGADVMPPGPGSEEAAIRLFTTDPDAGAAKPEGTISLAEGLTAEGMYLSDETLHVLLSTAWWGIFGSRHIEPGYWEAQQVTIDAYDVATPAEPERTSRLEIEGALVSSRRSGDNIYIVSRHTPQIEGLTPYPATEEEAAENERILEEAAESDILPEIQLNGEPVSPFSLDDCYRQDVEHPLATDQPGDPVITTLLNVSSTTGEIVSAACLMESIDGISLGAQFIALSFVRWDLASDETLIHLLNLNNLEYVGSESVSGALYTGGHADFRINEFEGALRLLTTRWTDNEEDAFEHLLYILKPDSAAPELERLAVLGDSPDHRIGKPNEDLYGVRFKGRRAYLVTFERIDPLYVLDLGDPENPAIVGELEVPGLSDLLHEVSPELLLGLGRSADQLPKLELYDISDVSAPISQSLIELGVGWDWAYSPAQYNRYALTYLAGDDVDRLTVPYSAQRSNRDTNEQIDRIALFEIHNKDEPSRSRIAAVGEVALRPGSVGENTRAIIDLDALYVIANTDLLSGFWSNPEAMQAVTD